MSTTNLSQATADPATLPSAAIPPTDGQGLVVVQPANMPDNALAETLEAGSPRVAVAPRRSLFPSRHVPAKLDTAAKRMIDIAISATVLLLCVPVLLLAALLVAVDSN